eukprot:maker-scaffold178_size283195-snap-gene-1.41 protein:Tk10269 transcript:maker-scaffold178_size283195-snap-gene-1.41-mRNA-1 annotation:"hypothetical protein DAPPUDRAFT_269522"
MAKPPNSPFEDVTVDLFYFHGQCYLIYLSRLRLWFRSFGLPSCLRSDNGPQFKSHEFSIFLSCTIERLLESSVKAAKQLLAKACPDGNLDSDDFVRALLELRNSPLNSGSSPSSIVFGHEMRSSLPCLPAKYKRPDMQAITSKKSLVSARQAHLYNRGT